MNRPRLVNINIYSYNHNVCLLYTTTWILLLSFTVVMHFYQWIHGTVCDAHRCAHGVKTTFRRWKTFVSNLGIVSHGKKLKNILTFLS